MLPIGLGQVEGVTHDASVVLPHRIVDIIEARKLTQACLA
jgi:hypothetical protein